MASWVLEVFILACANPSFLLFCGLAGEKGWGQVRCTSSLPLALQTYSTHSPPEALRIQVEGVEPVDAGGEVCIVSAVCVADTNAWTEKMKDGEA